MSRPLAQRLFTNLPPLVSAPELSAELYELIALSLRAYVVPWWSKISRYDKQFLPEIASILTVVVHNLHARIDAANVPRLLLVNTPTLLSQHYRDFRNAQLKLHTSYAAGGAASLPQLFHQLQPHMAVSPDGRLDTEYFRHLIDHILSVCLPDDDYQPQAERFVVRELILKLLLNDTIPKITQPWFIHRSILDLLRLYSHPPLPSLPRPASPPPSSFHTFIVLVLSAIQAISGACLALIQAYKNTLNTIKHLNQHHPPNPTPQNYANPLLTMLSDIFTLHHRMASTSILTSARITADFSSSFLDRLLPYLLQVQLSPTFILSITRISKRTLFPNGYPGPPPIEPTPEEQAETRALLIDWRPTGILASRLLPLLLGPDPSKTLEAALDPLSSAPCNVHLVLFLLDLIILELFPELALPANGTPGENGITPSARDGQSVTGSEAS